jgi:hypothetical protein
MVFVKVAIKRQLLQKGFAMPRLIVAPWVGISFEYLAAG